jgi:hypothetical protein
VIQSTGADFAVAEAELAMAEVDEAAAQIGYHDAVTRAAERGRVG